MNAFKLENPILEKIKSVVETFLTDKGIIANIVYFDFEPSEMMIDGMDKDGAIAVYAKEISFKPGEGSTTGTQDSTNLIAIDSYGFGDPLKDISDNWEPTIKEAQNRGEILTTLSYKAVMDRTEYDNAFGTDIDLSDKFPQSIIKYSPQGVSEHKRGACIYRSVYSLRIEEDPPQEPLGPNLSGSDWTSPTYNPGEEPEA